MKESSVIENFKAFVSSIGWRMFIWGLGITQEDYWERIYQQEKQFKNGNQSKLEN